MTRAASDQVVYFIRATESNRVKIGVATNPLQRLADLQVGSPEILELIGTVPGGRKLEERLHRALESDRVHGEWFELTDRVILAIGDLLGWRQHRINGLEELVRRFEREANNATSVEAAETFRNAAHRAREELKCELERPTLVRGIGR